MLEENALRLGMDVLWCLFSRRGISIQAD